MEVTVKELRETLNNRYVNMPHVVRVSLKFVHQEKYFNRIVNKQVRSGQDGSFGYELLGRMFVEFFKDYFKDTYYCPDEKTTERVLVMIYNLSKVSKTSAINLTRGIMLEEIEEEPTIKPDLKVQTKVKSNRSADHMRKMREAKERKRQERLRNENKKANK